MRRYVFGEGNNREIKPVDKDNNLFLYDQVGKYFSGCIILDEKENFEAEKHYVKRPKRERGFYFCMDFVEFCDFFVVF